MSHEASLLQQTALFGASHQPAPNNSYLLTPTSSLLLLVFILNDSLGFAGFEVNIPYK